MYGLSPVLNVTASVVPFTTDLMVGMFGPITCSEKNWLIDVLQYTEYPVMIPLRGIGKAQLVESEVGNPVTGNKVTFKTEDGTENDIEFLNSKTFELVLLECT